MAPVVATPCLRHPRWKRKVFSVAGRDYDWLDVFLAAMLRGAWRPFATRLEERLACLAEATRRRLLPDVRRIEQEATAFRYGRNLLTTDETVAWLTRADLTVDAWTDFLVGRLLRSEGTDRRDALLGRSGDAPDISEGAFAAEGICSGCFDQQALALAGRAAVSAMCADPTPDVVDLAHIQRTRREHAAWLGALDAADLGRFAHLAPIDATYEAGTRVSLTDEAVAEQVARHRRDWTRIDLERLVFDRLDGALEAAWCVREDGLTLSDVAIESRLQVHDSRELLERLEPELRDTVLGAARGQLVGPVLVGSQYELALIVAKDSPDPADPLVRARAEQAIVSRLVDKAVRSQVRWVERPSDTIFESCGDVLRERR
jgi:hypothetical protein